MKTLKTPTKMLAAAVIGACGLAWGATASAASIASGFVPGENTITDDDVELFVDADLSGSVTAGDYFMGLFGMQSIAPSGDTYSSAIVSGDMNEFTGIFLLEVDTLLAGGIPGAACGVGAAGTCSSFTLTSASAGMATVLDAIAGSGLFGFTDFNGSTAATLLAGISADTWLVAFEDTTPNWTFSGLTRQESVDNAVDGTQILELGTGGTALGATLITSFGPTDPALIPGLPGGSGVGNFAVANASINSTTLPLDPTFGVQGIGSVSSPSAGNPWDIKTNVDFTVRAVPEPASLALMGLGLIGLGAARRRWTKSA